MRQFLCQKGCFLMPKRKAKKDNKKQISNEELENLLESGSDIDLIERAARDKLDYVYENEEIYEDSSGK